MIILCSFRFLIARSDAATWTLTALLISVARYGITCNEAVLEFGATFDFTRLSILLTQVLNDGALVLRFTIICCLHNVHLPQSNLYFERLTCAHMFRRRIHAKTITWRLFFSQSYCERSKVFKDR